MPYKPSCRKLSVISSFVSSTTNVSDVEIRWIKLLWIWIWICMCDFLDPPSVWHTQATHTLIYPMAWYHGQLFPFNSTHSNSIFGHLLKTESIRHSIIPDEISLGGCSNTLAGGISLPELANVSLRYQQISRPPRLDIRDVHPWRLLATPGLWASKSVPWDVLGKKGRRRET